VGLCGSWVIWLAVSLGTKVVGFVNRHAGCSARIVGGGKSLRGCERVCIWGMCGMWGVCGMRGLNRL
jgi:hypothetical protein